MKKLMCNILIVLVLAIVGDRAIGLCLSHAFANTRYDEIGRQNYICDSVNSDIIVLGSSRALHHYVPGILTQSTGLSCYNCGFEGEGIVFHYALLRQLQQRYSPRLIIYELTYDYDVQYLSWRPANISHIRPMSHLQCRDSILYSVDRWERLSMLSRIYPYNSLMFKSLFSRRPSSYDQSDVDNGYMPQYKVIDTTQCQEIRHLKWNESIDELKVGYLKKLITENAGQLMVVVSPRYMSTEDDIYGAVERLCEEHGVPFYCFVSEPKISRDATMWEDDGHLNDKGAREFTRLVAPLAKQLLDLHTQSNNLNHEKE